MKKLIRELLGERAISFYHYCLAFLAGLWFGFPSKNLAVIGVVGTKGKTSTANFIHSCLQAGGCKTGMISTANIKIASQEFLNKFHMTMPGPFVLQNYLKQMRKNGCFACVVETTSEGIKQFRHKGISYDILVFTNLSAEHLPSHKNSFEEYKKTKGRIFSELHKISKKTVAKQQIKKTIIANIDDENSQYFLGFSADKKITYGLSQNADFKAENLQSDSSGVSFCVKEKPYRLNILGEYNVYNALPAIVIADVLAIGYEAAKQGLAGLKNIPGRMEKIEADQNFAVLVDYAHEQKSMKLALEAAKKLAGGFSKVIVLLGAEGGGRDKSKRPKMGEIAGQLADFVIVSNVDPYDDNPQEIIEDIAKAVEASGKQRNISLFAIEDRRQGIKKALSLAKQGDVVLITGKGAEQSMIIKAKKIPWDDREVVKEGLKNYGRMNNN